MKIQLSLLFSFLFSLSMLGTDHVINTIGLAYDPSELTVNIGDNITINASSVHPTTQVSQETWEANGTTPLVGGFGTNTASFTFTVEDLGSIYYVCDSHVANGMKGLINVLPVGISELVDAAGFNLNSNPLIDGLLNFNLDDETLIGSQIEIYDLNGRMAFQYRVMSEQGVIQTGLKSGYYLMTLRNEKKVILVTERIVIEE